MKRDRILALLVMLVLSACQPHLKPSPTDRPKSPAPAASDGRDSAAPVVVVPMPQPQVSFEDPAAELPVLLQGLPPDDLKMLEERAQENFPERHWQIVADNSRFVRGRVVDVLTQKGLPPELQMVPAIESRYNPYLVSPAGAAGLWQFMPGTARAMGLACNNDLNDMRDVEKSTKAAATYLQALQQRFVYWPLALAAYNCGPARLAKFLRNEGGWKPSDGLDALPAPQASKAYVKNILSLAYAEHSGSLQFPEAQRVRRIQQRGLNIRQLSRQTKLSDEVLLRLNPKLERVQYGARDSITLCLPDQTPWQDERSSRPLKPQPQRSKRITIKTGDTLWMIAQRYHTSVKELRKANPGIKKMLRPGQKLRVPVKVPLWRNPLCQN